MKPELFEVPFLGIKIFGYGLMLFLAFVGSMNLAAWKARRERVDPEIIYDLALYVFFGGLIGARAFFVAQHWSGFRSAWDVFKIWEGGIVLYGSIIGGTLTFFVYWAIRRFPLRPVLDIVAPALALGIAIGRFGCFLNGCCFGDPCRLPWAVEFPKHSPAWITEVNRGLIGPEAAHSLPLHPTQLYSVVDGLVIMALLLAYFPLRRRDGAVMALLMVTYPITRFLIEILRSDEWIFWGGMTVSQDISVALFLAGLAFWAYLLRSTAVRYADLAEPISTLAPRTA